MMNMNFEPHVVCEAKLYFDLSHIAAFVSEQTQSTVCLIASHGKLVVHGMPYELSDDELTALHIHIESLFKQVGQHSKAHSPDESD
jgi:hypothetical protein